MRITVGLLLVLSILGASWALDGVNGSTETLLFSSTDLLTDTSYPSTFEGVRWDDSSFFQVGFGLTDEGQFLAADGDGNVFVIVVGHRDRELGPRPRGLVQWDGSGFVHLVQYPTDYDDETETFTRGNLWAVAVSPVTAGLLTAGHPVIVKEAIQVGPTGAGEPSWELWSVDPTTSPATETLVHVSSIEVHGIVIGAGGSIYVQDDAALMRLTFNGTGYDEDVLADVELVRGTLTIGGDGALYGLDALARWGEKKGENDILRIDPYSGAVSAYASVSRKLQGCFALVGGDDGRLWIGLEDGSLRADIVTEVLSGKTIGTRSDSVSNSSLFHGRTVAGGSNGALYIAEHDGSWEATEVFELVPGEDRGGSGGGGGGGGGGGKGRNK